VKLIARQQGELAVARGVFGSPWIFETRACGS
jgi:hypothetical protein